MSASSKPISRQPGGGRGRLLAPVTGRSYDGTYELPNGKFDRRIFKQPSNAKAVKAYEEWCKEMDERILRAMQEKVRPKKSRTSLKRFGKRREQSCKMQTRTGRI